MACTSLYLTNFAKMEVKMEAELPILRGFTDFTDFGMDFTDFFNFFTGLKFAAKNTFKKSRFARALYRSSKQFTFSAEFSAELSEFSAEFSELSAEFSADFFDFIIA